MVRGFCSWVNWDTSVPPYVRESTVRGLLAHTILHVKSCSRYNDKASPAWGRSDHELALEVFVLCFVNICGTFSCPPDYWEAANHSHWSDLSESHVCRLMTVLTAPNRHWQSFHMVFNMMHWTPTTLRQYIDNNHPTLTIMLSYGTFNILQTWWYIARGWIVPIEIRTEPPGRERYA